MELPTGSNLQLADYNQLLYLLSYKSIYVGIPTPTMTAATPHIAVFPTSGKNKVSRIYLPKAHTKLPLCVERLVSCIHYIRQVLPPKETVSTLVDQIIYLGCSSNSI